MSTKTNNPTSVKNSPSSSVNHTTRKWSRTFIIGEAALTIGLILIALLPRILLASQLDMVTDEVVYILGGKVYFPLLMHFHIGAIGWLYNYEHPPVVKLLIGFSLWLNNNSGHPIKELFAARLPSVLMGTLLVVVIYWIGRSPFGRVVSLLAALCLAVSPWLAYFSALAYLDMTMTAFITAAYLLTWHAVRRPWLYLVVALLVGLGAASKYTAVLIVPPIVLFTAYYYFVIRFTLPREQRPKFPWLWWLAAITVSPLVFLAADPAIWPHPIPLLLHSFLFEWNHSSGGHLTFFAGLYSLHIPHWAILYMMLVKLSAFVTLPAAGFAIYALVQLVRFHSGKDKSQSVAEIAMLSFLLIWLVSSLAMFSLLNIVVGTHYFLPLAPPIALSAAVGLATLFRYRRDSLFALIERRSEGVAATDIPVSSRKTRASIRTHTVFATILMTFALVVPHLLGLVTVYGAEGYTSEFFHGEDNALQVAYPAYREAALWIATHTHGPEKVGLVAIVGTLAPSKLGVSWYDYNKDLPTRLSFSEAHPEQSQYQYNYLIWPMHLIQRGYSMPQPWRSHVVHVVMGGATVYCYVLGQGT